VTATRIGALPPKQDAGRLAFRRLSLLVRWTIFRQPGADLQSSKGKALQGAAF
jgi:hypothetical protein